MFMTTVCTKVPDINVVIFSWVSYTFYSFIDIYTWVAWIKYLGPYYDVGYLDKKKKSLYDIL